MKKERKKRWKTIFLKTFLTKILVNPKHWLWEHGQSSKPTESKINLYIQTDFLTSAIIRLVSPKNSKSKASSSLADCCNDRFLRWMFWSGSSMIVTFLSQWQNVKNVGKQNKMWVKEVVNHQINEHQLCNGRLQRNTVHMHIYTITSIGEQENCLFLLCLHLCLHYWVYCIYLLV